MKKWTYLVAAGLLAGATPVFTGCIDNDEPEGITILRQAKAELISAKKAIAEAEALRVKAEAAKLEADAEVSKAEAELIRAKAELKLAEAAQKEALTESKKAFYAAQIAKIEAYIAMIKAQTEEYIANAEAARQAAEDQHQKALIEIEKAKNTLSAEELEMLKTFQTKYDNAANEYNNRYIAYTNAQTEYLKALADAEEGQQDIEDKRILEKNVQNKQDWVALKNAELEEAQAILEEVMGYEPGTLAVQLEEAEAELARIAEELNTINIQIAEERIKNDAEYKKQADLQREYNLYTSDEEKKIYADPLTVQISNRIPGYGPGEYEIIPENELYFWVDKNGNTTTGTQDGYLIAKNYVNNWINDINQKTLDEDDQAWTQASINEMTAELEGLNKTYEADLATWERAVAGYNAGKGTDYSKYTGYATLSENVTTYNAAVKEYEPLRADYVAKAELSAEAEAAWLNYTTSPETEKHTAWSIYEASLIIAFDNYNAVVSDMEPLGSAWVTYYATLASLQNAVIKATEDVKVAEAELALLQEQLRQDPTNIALQTQVTEAQKKLGNTPNEGLRKVLADAQAKLTTGDTDATKVRENAITIAQKQLELALAEADKEYENNKIDWSASETYNGELIDPAYVEQLRNNYDDAKEAEEAAYNLYQPKKEAAATAYKNMAKAYSELKKNVLADKGGIFGTHGEYNPPIIENELGINGEESLEIAADEKATTFDMEDLVINSKNFIIVASRIVYGLPSMYDKENDELYYNELLTPERLKELTQEELNSIIIAEHKLEEEAYKAPDYYEFYGSFGLKLAKERDIDYAEAYINEQPALNAILKTLNDYLDNLETVKDTRADEVLAAYEAWEAQTEVIAELEKPMTEKRNELNMKHTLQNDLVASILFAMNTAGTSEESKRDQEAIDNLIAEKEGVVKTCKDNLFQAETELQQAEQDLDDFNNDLFDLADSKKTAMDNAKYYLDVAKTTLDTAAAQLQMIIERLGITTETGTEE